MSLAARLQQCNGHRAKFPRLHRLKRMAGHLLHVGQEGSEVGTRVARVDHQQPDPAPTRQATSDALLVRGGVRPPGELRRQEDRFGLVLEIEIGQRCLDTS